MTTATELRQNGRREPGEAICAALGFRRNIVFERVRSRLDDCCSSIKPCAHQRSDAYSVCDTCRAALRSVTIRLPPGYKNAEEFARDCEFELAEQVLEGKEMICLEFLAVAALTIFSYALLYSIWKYS